ncbi:hypothetical protein [Caldiplasma sukawensis]
MKVYYDDHCEMCKFIKNLDSKSSHEYLPMSVNPHIPKDSIYIQQDDSILSGYDAVLSLISSYEFTKFLMPYMLYLKKIGLGDRLYSIIALKRRNFLIENLFRLLNRLMFHKQ